MPSRRLLIFGRLPEAGATKTRLIPALGANGAARLYQAFLDDVMDAAAALPSATTELWVPERPGAADVLSARYPDVGIRLQRGADLGERMAHAFDRAFEEGTDCALVFGSDHPTLPPGYLTRGFDALIAAHLVLGPTEDGGYYVIGLRRHAWPRARPLFFDMPWSTRRVLQLTRQRAAELDLCHVRLPSWYDVDEPSDLLRLKADARPGSQAARVLGELPNPAAAR